MDRDWVVVALLSLLAGGGARSDTPPTVAPTNSAPTIKQNHRLDTITVEAKRERTELERRVSAFVSSAIVNPFEGSLARWSEPIGNRTASQISHIISRPQAVHVWYNTDEVGGDRSVQFEYRSVVAFHT